MQFVICGQSGACAYLQSLGASITWIEVRDVAEAKRNTADAFFFLEEGMLHSDFGFTNKPVFVNAVTTLKSNFPGIHENIYRFNAWPGFLQNDTWEIVGKQTLQIASLAAALNKRFYFVPDIAGFVAPRIIVNIINEAYLALEEKVGTRSHIDIAMKQGTNYPLGPFEWAGKIGHAEVINLLEVLAQEQQSFPVSRLLAEEAKSKSSK